jgi:phytoene desaturase
MKKPLNIVIIGAGLAGIAAALRLRRLGHAVTVLERSSDHGGKLSMLEWNGFRWDRGPSLFTEPALVDELFTLYGEDPREHFNYTPRETACTYFFPDCEVVHFYTDRGRLKRELSEKLTPELAEKTLAYLDESRSVYQRIGTFFTNSPQPNLKDVFRKDLLVRYPQLLSSRLRKTLHGYNKGKLADRRLVQLFDRFGTYNGSDPFRMSGLYSMIPHLEHNDGTYFPQEGMRSIADALYRLAVKNGVEFRFGQQVRSAVLTNSSGYEIRSNSDILIADKLVCAIDHLPFYRDILKDEKQYINYHRQERSSSALVFYWAVDRIVPQLGLHTVFFSSDYKQEFAEIFDSKTFPSEPTVYVHISSTANPSDAPEGCQNWFVMINTPSGVIPDAVQTDALRDLIFRRIRQQLGISLATHILFEKTWDAHGIEKDTGSEKGALYGASSNGKLAALKRHGNKNRHYPNLYFCGGTVHPGGGIPLVLRSAGIVEQLIAHES